MSDTNNFLYKKVQAHLAESARVKRAVAGLTRDFHIAGPAIAAASAQGIGGETVGRITPIIRAAEFIADAFRSGGKLLLCGNGGSAADCQHMAAEFISRLSRDFERPALPAIALTTDTSFITAYANDVDFEGVFSRQIEALGKAGDVLIAISTSGASPNIIRAVQAARTAGIRTIGLTAAGRRLTEITDVAIAVPSANVNHIQEAHLAIEHIICDLVEQLLFAKDSRPDSEPLIEPEAV